MSETKVLRVMHDQVGWTVDGDRHPRSYLEKSQAIERARVVADTSRPCRLQILSESGEVEEESAFA
jgi:hypothetical protein